MNITKKTTDGLPIKEIAVDSLRLFPPEYVPAQRSLYGMRLNFFKFSFTIYKGRKLASIKSFIH
jgi:hypothetical protein